MLSENRYQEVTRKLQSHGAERAEVEYRSGAEGPQDAPFSGEYADGLTFQRVLDMIGQPVMEEELTPEEADALMGVWEDFYWAGWQELLATIA